MEKIFYINYFTVSGWVYPIINRLNGTSNALLKARYSAHWNGRETDLGRLALALDAKLSKLPAIIEIVDRDIRLLDEELKDRKAEVDTCIARRSGLRLRQERLALSLPANIESFLYHSRSAYELLSRFLIAFNRRILEKRISGEDIERILQEEGISTEWIDALKDDRDLTAHQSALWCDLRVVTDEPRTYEVLVGEIHDIDPAHYRPLGSYTKIYSDFANSLTKLTSWLLREIDAAETA